MSKENVDNSDNIWSIVLVVLAVSMIVGLTYIIIHANRDIDENNQNWATYHARQAERVSEISLYKDGKIVQTWVSLGYVIRERNGDISFNEKTTGKFWSVNGTISIKDINE